MREWPYDDDFASTASHRISAPASHQSRRRAHPRAHRAGAPAGRDGRDVPVEHHHQCDGQSVLRRRRMGRFKELGGAAVRVAGPAQFHHRGQTAGLAVGHGVVRAAVRLQQRQHAGSRGADGRGGGGVALRCGQADQRAARGAAGRCGVSVNAGGGVDVSLQQPRRRDGVADDGRRLLHGARAAPRQRSLDRAGRGGAGIRLPCQDARRIDGDARHRAGVPARRANPATPTAVAPAGLVGSVHRVRGLVRGAHADLAGVVAPLHRGLHRQQLHESRSRIQRVCPGSRT